MIHPLKAAVIIPTCDRAPALDRCLRSLTQQTMPLDAFEVLVVDNGRTRQTHEMAERYASALPLTYLCAPEPGLHVGRHQGMKSAQSDILIYADDDIEAEPTWVEAIVDTFQDPGIALVGGNNYPLFEEEPPDWLKYWWRKRVYKGRALWSLSILDFGAGVFEIDPAYVWGCNFSIRRPVLLEAGGFHPDGFPQELLHLRGDGETHVSHHVGRGDYKAVFNSRASVHHRIPAVRMTPPYFEQRAFAQAVSDSYADVRRSHGFHSSTLLRVRAAMKRLASCARINIGSVLFAANPARKKLAKVQAAMLQAYWRGYRFHQAQVRLHSDLLAWVLRETYF
jgi:glucosyl-dolichyl phosphate glucuronosyltransferase